MKTVRIRENKRLHESLIDAKETFLRKLQTALDKENSIASAISRVDRLPASSKHPDTDIHLTFSARTWKNKKGEHFMDRFVYNVNDAHHHRKNVEKISTLIKATKSELESMREANNDEPRSKSVRTLHIHFRNGTIKPTELVPDPGKYHWEMQSNVSCHPTSWSQIGQPGDTDIRPSLSSGEVRLSYDGGELVSNKIKLTTVIKRQAATAKRRQYRYERDDPAFIQRCRGVAGRIQRMLKPGRLIAGANFATRVFQDRVSQLPQHLGSEVANDDEPETYGPRRFKSITLYIAELCESGTTDDDEYVHMIEFVEPTVYLNPRGLYDALTDIYKGKGISLRLPVGGRAEEDARERTMRQGNVLRQEQDNVKARKAAEEEKQRRDKAKARKAAEEEKQRRDEAELAKITARKIEDTRLRQLELEEIERDKQAELANIARERAQANQDLEVQRERIKEETRALAQQAIDDASRLDEERKRFRIQAEIDAIEYPLPSNFKGFLTTYDTVVSAQKKGNGGDWIRARSTNNIYRITDTKKGAAKKDIVDANAAGWYEKATLDQEAADNAAAILVKEEIRLAKEADDARKEAEAERQRLEEERIRTEAAADAERQRLTKEADDARKEAEAERQRLAKEADDARKEAEAERQRLEEAEAERQRLEEERIRTEAARKIAVDALRNDDDAVAFIRYVFTTYDTNKNNEIDELELVRAYFVGKTKVNAGAGRDLIDENDQDGSGTIDEQEFIDWCAVSGVMENIAWQQGAKEFKERLAATTVNEKITVDGKEFVVNDIPEAVDIKAGLRAVRVGGLFRVPRLKKIYKKTGSRPRQYEIVRTYGSTPVSAGLFMLEENLEEENVQPQSGALSAMINSMSTHWVSSDEELMDFAEASEDESRDFAASSSLDTDSDMEFAQTSEKSAHQIYSEEESSEKTRSSSSMDFAESSAIDTDSEMEFAETSDKTSSGLEFAESSAVESD